MNMFRIEGSISQSGADFLSIRQVEHHDPISQRTIGSSPEASCTGG